MNIEDELFSVIGELKAIWSSDFGKSSIVRSSASKDQEGTIRACGQVPH